MLIQSQLVFIDCLIEKVTNTFITVYFKEMNISVLQQQCYREYSWITWDSHIVSGLYPGTALGGSFTQALLGILAFPIKFKGMLFSGMTFSKRVDTTLKRQQKRGIYASSQLLFDLEGIGKNVFGMHCRLKHLWRLICMTTQISHAWILPAFLSRESQV